MDSDKVTLSEWFTLGLLCEINVLNYMDRFGAAGVLIHIQAYFHITNDLTVLLQSALVIAYLLSAPIFGYFGDRYSRRICLMVCVGSWGAMVFLASCTEYYWQFLLCRFVMGAFQAGFTTIAPTLISDIVSKNTRTKILSIFNAAAPLGAGVGYMTSSSLAELIGSWRWGLRFTPILSAASTVMLFFVVNPARGAKETEAIRLSKRLGTTSFKVDIQYLLHNTSFLLNCFALTCITFYIGTLVWWVPKYLYYGFTLISNNGNIKLSDVMRKFGLITVTANIFGALSGSLLSIFLRKRYSFTDPIICGVGCLLSLPLISGALWCAAYVEFWTFVLIFFGQWTLNCIWPIVGDILLYVVVPTRRSAAEGLRIFITHFFGDLWSPYIVGFLLELYKKNSYDRISNIDTHKEVQGFAEFHPLKLCFFTIAVIHFIGVILFFISALYINRGRQAAAELAKRPQS